MAGKLQTDPLPKPLEQMLAEINAAAIEEAEKKKTPPPAEPLTIPSLDDCAKLSKEELLKLVERMACQCGLVAAMTDEQVYRMGMDRLAYAISICPATQGRELSTVFDRWADRYRGKPAMTVNQNFTMTLEQLVLQSYKEPMKTIEGGKG